MGDCSLWGVTCENEENSPHYWATFFHGFHIKCDKSVLGYILGDFFTNLSGHPGGGKIFVVLLIFMMAWRHGSSWRSHFASDEKQNPVRFFCRPFVFGSANVVKLITRGVI
jgi:hypothetical protein